MKQIHVSLGAGRIFSIDLVQAVTDSHFHGTDQIPVRDAEGKMEDPASKVAIYWLDHDSPQFHIVTRETGRILIGLKVISRAFYSATKKLTRLDLEEDCAPVFDTSPLSTSGISAQSTLLPVNSMTRRADTSLRVDTDVPKSALNLCASCTTMHATFVQRIRCEYKCQFGTRVAKCGRCETLLPLDVGTVVQHILQMHDSPQNAFDPKIHAIKTNATSFTLLTQGDMVCTFCGETLHSEEECTSHDWRCKFTLEPYCPFYKSGKPNSCGKFRLENNWEVLDHLVLEHESEYGAKRATIQEYHSRQARLHLDITREINDEKKEHTRKLKALGEKLRPIAAEMIEYADWLKKH